MRLCDIVSENVYDVAVVDSVGLSAFYGAALREDFYLIGIIRLDLILPNHYP